MYDEDDDSDREDEFEDDGEARARQGVATYRPPSVLAGDPSQFAWPATLAMEIACKVAPVKQVCLDHGITRERWNELRQDPRFIAEMGRAVEAVRVDGLGFKARAGLQAVEMLKTSWALVHDITVPPAVRARLISATVKWAGLDASAMPEAAVKAGVGFQIQIVMG